MKRLAAALCVGVLALAACSSNDSDSATTGEPGSSETPPDSDRLRVDGLTLVYPTDVFVSAAEADTPREGAAVTIEYDTDDDASAAELTVVVVRSATGEDSDALSDDDRDRLESLEQLLDSNEDSENELTFVNGVGVRALEDGYVFDGLTNDGQFLVGFSSELTGIDAELDAMIRSVFVDGAADVYGSVDCADDVELINENGLEEGSTAEPGAEVTASWEVRNAGSCTWGPQHSWTFTGGEPVTIVSTSSLAGTEAGATVEVEVVFLAPAEQGQYAAQWQVQAPGQLEPLGTPAFALFTVE